MKANIKELTAVFMLLVGVALAFIALFMPPPGEIHDSVLYIFAQILIYAGSVFGISAYIDNFRANEKNEKNFNSREQPKVKE